MVKVAPGASPEDFFDDRFGDYERVVGSVYMAPLLDGGPLEALRVAHEFNSSPKCLWSSPNFAPEGQLLA